MYIGLEFNIDFGKKGNQLKDILLGIDISAYDWVLNHQSIQELYIVNENGTGINRLKSYTLDCDNDTDLNLYDYTHCDEKKYIPGEILLKEQSADKYYFLFLSLFGFKKGDKITKISNIEELMESKCELFFTVYDSKGMAVIVKDQVILEKIHSNLKKIGGTNISLMDLEYCRRFNMFS